MILTPKLIVVNWLVPSNSVRLHISQIKPLNFFSPPSSRHNIYYGHQIVLYLLIGCDSYYGIFHMYNYSCFVTPMNLVDIQCSGYFEQCLYNFSNDFFVIDLPKFSLNFLSQPLGH